MQSAALEASSLYSRRPALMAAALLLAAAEVYVDFDTWISLNVSILYGVPLVLAAAAGGRRLLWGLTAVLIVATFIVYSHQIQPHPFSFREPFFLNRVLAVMALLITAGLLHTLGVAVEALQARAREEQEASERKTRLLASVSHDIHSPLTTINLIAEMIRNSAGDPARGAQTSDLARSLQANAHSLTDLVSDVMDASYFGSGQIALRESEFALHELLAEECRLLEAAASAKGLALDHEPQTPPIGLYADRIKLGRIVRNLINNAIKFTAKGRIAVDSSLTPEREVLIRVRDTGCGIAAEDLERIFREFARVHDPVRHGGGGWGLGLAICRRLAGLMGGTIDAESEPDRGSIFTVRLPASRVFTEHDHKPTSG